MVVLHDSYNDGGYRDRDEGKCLLRASSLGEIVDVGQVVENGEPLCLSLTAFGRLPGGQTVSAPVRPSRKETSWVRDSLCIGCGGISHMLPASPLCSRCIQNDVRSHGANFLTKPGAFTVKITIRKDSKGILCAYIPRTDLEEPIVSIARARMWGGLVTLANGWQFELPELAPDTVLPVTVEARRLAGGHD